MDNKELNLSSPWMIFYHELEILFSKDKQIKMTFDNDAVVAKLYVDDSEKADALERILPYKVDFGNVTMFIEVNPPNGEKTKTIDWFKKAFNGNEAVYLVDTAKTPHGSDVNFVAFKPDVCQYFADNLCSIWGLETCLYEDVAIDVFSNWLNEIHFCTEPIEKD